MEANVLRVCVLMGALVSLGATHRTPNFTVHADDPQVARQVAAIAEESRQALAREWLGEALPRWQAPCVVRVRVDESSPGGATSFSFHRTTVVDLSIAVNGPLEQILESVVPHEVSHTVFASRFCHPLPRWADEGAATLCEAEAEQHRQKLRVKQLLRNRRQMPLRRLLEMIDYPPGGTDVFTLYAQGFSITDFLVQTGGKDRFIVFLKDARQRSWDEALKRIYGFKNVESFEREWNEWVAADSPRLETQGRDFVHSAPPRPPALASANDAAD
jgi:hypothetical protein